MIGSRIGQGSDGLRNFRHSPEPFRSEKMTNTAASAEFIGNRLYGDTDNEFDQSEVEKAAFLLGTEDRAFGLLATINHADLWDIAFSGDYEGLPDEIRQKVSADDVATFAAMGLPDPDNLVAISDMRAELYPNMRDPLEVVNAYFPEDGSEGKQLPGETSALTP